MSHDSQIKKLPVLIHPSFMRIFRDGCRSALFHLMLSMIAEKSVGALPERIQAGNITWRATAEDITERLLCIWSLNKVRKEVDNLFTSEIIGKIGNPDIKMDRTTHFSFGVKEGRQLSLRCNQYAVCISHHMDLSSNILFLLNQTFTINECCCSSITDKGNTSSRFDLNKEREKARVKSHLDNAIRSGAEATLTLDEWLATLRHFNYQCAYCQGPYELLEHFIPTVIGGGTSKNNCVPACHKCNAYKLNYHPLLLPASSQLNKERINLMQEYLRSR